MAEAKASTPDNMQEMLALVIDHETSAEVSRINKEIGSSVYRWRQVGRERLSCFNRLLKEHEFASQVKDVGYAILLKEYVELKLSLHVLRKSAYYRGDLYYEREDIDVKKLFDRCSELRQQIKQFRQSVTLAAWGVLEPERHTAYDKPLLYAMDEHTCSFVVIADDEDNDTGCPLSAGHWYHGKPYCRAHLREARHKAKMENRAGIKSFS